MFENVVSCISDIAVRIWYFGVQTFRTRSLKSKSMNTHQRRRTSSWSLTEDHETHVDGFEDTLFEQTGELSFLQALFTSLNYNLGLAALCFPHDITEAGWLGFIMMLGACIVCWATALMLGNILDHDSTLASYADIGAGATRNVGLHRYAHMASTSIRLVQVMELFCYLAYGIKASEEALIQLLEDTSSLELYGILIVLVAPLLFVTTWPRMLSFLSLLGTATFAAVYLLIVGSSVSQVLQFGLKGEDMVFMSSDIKRVSMSYGCILLLFAGHAVYPSLHANLHRKEDYPKVVNYTFVVLLFGLVSIALLSIVAWGVDGISELPTGSLPNGLLNVAGQCLLILKCLMAYPLMMYPITSELIGLWTHSRARSFSIEPYTLTPLLRHADSESAESHLVGLQYSPFLPRVSSPSSQSYILRDSGVSFAVSVLVFLVAGFVSSLGILMSFVGAIFAVSLAVTFPGLCYLCIFGRHSLYLSLIAIFFGIASTAFALFGFL